MASYGGALRATYLRPELSARVRTLRDVLESGLPWKIIVYGDDFELEWERSEDEDVRRFWQEKVPLSYQEHPLEMVRTCYPRVAT